MGRRRIPTVSGSDPGHADRLRHRNADETLDLHGLEVWQAESKVRFFLERTARQHAGGVVRIVTGRGLHSSDGPRLREAVEALLRERPEVAEQERALDGGSVLVRLR
ncbi:MAG: Smr/MutS family protein [Gemmatimonadota bacterium]|nr:Smr/MutS family protein [Gemmatimonadota bacterium]